MTEKENNYWLKENAVSIGKYLYELDSDLYSESEKLSKLFSDNAQNILLNEVHLGGGGCYPILYFFSRYIKPNTIVEMGVALGYSSSAFLSAIQKNEKDHL